jgi:hypothetical protein
LSTFASATGNLLEKLDPRRFLIFAVKLLRNRLKSAVAQVVVARRIYQTFVNNLPAKDQGEISLTKDDHILARMERMSGQQFVQGMITQWVICPISVPYPKLVKQIIFSSHLAIQ